MKILSSLLRHRRRSMLVLLAIGAAACIPIRREASWPSITLLDNKDEILMAYDDRVVLVNAKDGKPLELRNADGEIRVDENGKPLVWQFGGPKSSPNQFYAAPVLLSDTTLLIPSYDDHIYEVDIASARSRTPDGTPLDGRVLSSPTLSDNTLYMGIERDMVALDSANFDVRWKLPTGQGVWSKPLVVGEALYFTSLDHKLYAVNAATGDVNWSLDLEGAAPESPILHDNRLYVGSFARKIFEISLQGDILSEYDTKDWVWGAPTIVDGVPVCGGCRWHGLCAQSDQQGPGRTLGRPGFGEGDSHNAPGQRRVCGGRFPRPQRLLVRSNRW